jgi:hypothetical protein
LTVGTSEANGRPANFSGVLRLTTVSSLPVDPLDGDQADIKISTTLADVRKASNLADYTGQLQGQLQLRITDGASTVALGQKATTVDLPLSFTIPCQATPANPNRGSTCNLASSVDTLIAGALTEGTRSTWAIRGVSVFDGGPDEIAATPGNTEFATAGFFVP